MARKEPTFTFTYDDIAKLTCMSKMAVKKHVQRGDLDPSNLKSLCLFVTKQLFLEFLKRTSDP